MKVKDIVSLEIFNQVSVLAGNGGLNEVVRNTTFLDAPDGYYWCKEGDLILTTGYPFIKEEWINDLLGLMEKLVEKEVTAVGIKLGRYIPYIPQEVISYADEVKLPIISLPNNLSWADMIVAIISNINQSNLIELEKTHQVYEKFQEFLNRSANVDEISSFLSSIIHENVTIYFNNFNKLYSSKELNLSLEDMEEFIKKEYINKGEVLYKTKIANELCTVRWLKSASGLEGVIIIWSRDFKLDAWRKTALEQTAAIVSYEIEKMRSYSLTLQQFRNKLIEDLLNKNSKMERGVIDRRAKEVSWEISENYSVILTDIDSYMSSNYLKKMRMKEKIIEVLNQSFTKSASDVLIGFDNRNQIVLLLGSKEKEIDIVNSLKQILRGLSIKSAYIGTSEAHNITSILNGYKEAQLAMKILKETENNEKFKSYKIKHYKNLKIERIIYSRNPQEEIELLFKKYLFNVYEHDKLKDTDLLLTLKEFIKNNSNYEETAKLLYVHKNTVRYRINIVEKLSNLDLKENDNVFFLQLLLTSSR